MAWVNQIHRELADLIQSLDSTFSGQVILPEEPLHQREEGEETLLVLHFSVKPNNGIYKNCRVHFEAYFRSSYAEYGPEVNCMDIVAHPNIGFCGSVCISILDDWHSGAEEWHRDISSLVQAVLFLFYHPDFNDALVTFEGLEDLKTVVDATKRGTKPPDSVFTNIYEGSNETEDDHLNYETEDSVKTTQDTLQQPIPTKTDSDTADEKMAEVESDIDAVDR